MRLAVIPARGGSKRIPRKNIKRFNGKPILAYAIDAARATGLFDHILVSTDDEEIAHLAKLAGAEVPFFRPSELSDDHTPTVPVIAHAVATCLSFGWDVQEACCIYPAAPLIDPDDIARAYHLLTQGGSAYVFPVSPFPSAIQRALKLSPDATARPFFDQYVQVRSQDLEAGYFDAGQFYWGTRQAWLDGLTIHSNAKALVLPSWRVVDIDTPEDWERAEKLFQVIRSGADR